jgi:hypothetical protein
MQLAQANRVSPRNTELILVKICMSSRRFIKAAQTIVTQQTVIRKL